MVIIIPINFCLFAPAMSGFIAQTPSSFVGQWAKTGLASEQRDLVEYKSGLPSFPLMVIFLGNLPLRHLAIATLRTQCCQS